ncbi:MAG: Tad domain-containing protein [Rudaea sp.]
MEPKHSQQSGQSMILIALLLVALIAAAGLVLDGGRVYAARRQSQNASDGAALAGIRALVMGNGDAEIRSAIDTYASANFAAGPEDVTAFYLDENDAMLTLAPIGSWGTVPVAATGVSVTVAFHLDPWMMGVVNGGAPVEVNTTAAAQSGPPVSSVNLMPMTVMLPEGCDPNSSDQSQCFHYNEVVQLFGGVQGGGAFQWIAYNGANNPDTIAGYINQSISAGVVSIGDCIANSPGMQTANQIRVALDNWLPPMMPVGSAHWIIPIYGTVCSRDLNGNPAQYRVAAFAEFVLLGYDFGGNSNNPSTFTCDPALAPPGTTGSLKCIQGYFVKWVDPSPGKPGRCNTSGLNTCAMWLSR